MALPALQQTEPAPGRSDDVGDALSRATSHDLVFAVVGHAGAGASWVAQAMTEGLRSHSYEPVSVKLSKLIADAAFRIDPARWSDLNTLPSPSVQRTMRLQEAGNWLREQHGGTFTAALAIKHMHDRRALASSDTHLAFLIDSIKNPVEVDALRKVYGRSFYTVSVVCGPDLRMSRLRSKYKADQADVPELMRRDEAQEPGFGQHVRKTLQVGDFFVNNEAVVPPGGPGPLDQALARFLQIVFGTEVVRPTRDERGMYAAWTASLRSSCLSRQVGAAILSPDGQLIATGTNDVPRYGGGVYEESESGNANDCRCFCYPKPDDGETVGFCRNDKAKHEILAEAIKELREAKVVAPNALDEDIARALQQTPLNDLIEFSRAVHAEMDAIFSLARSGAASTRRGTLYCTTYPCHSCARHIVAAGIRDVVYIEPYLKSRAVELHDDTIRESTAPPPDDSSHVHLRLFTGVAPRRYSALFEKRTELKEDGRLRLRAESDALHTDPIFTKSHLEFEQLIAKHVEAATGGSAP
jgi:deoxycytidylate deaminase